MNADPGGGCWRHITISCHEEMHGENEALRGDEMRVDKIAGRYRQNTVV